MFKNGLVFDFEDIVAQGALKRLRLSQGARIQISRSSSVVKAGCYHFANQLFGTR